MVTRMIRWPWPPIMLRKFDVKLVIRGIEWAAPVWLAVETTDGEGSMMAEVRWKGTKTTALSSLRRTVKRNFTRVEVVRGDEGMVEWNEEFVSSVGLTAHKENAFDPWEIQIVVFHGLKRGSKNKASIVGMASLNVAQYAFTPGEEFMLNLPLLMPGVNSECQPIIHLSLKLLELRPCPESPDTAPLPFSSEKDELSALKAGLRKVKILTEFVSTRKSKKNSNRVDEFIDGRCSAGSEDADCIYPFDTDSSNTDLDEELQDGEVGSGIRKSFSYDTLATANYVAAGYEDWVYYSNRSLDVGSFHMEEAKASIPEKAVLQTKRSILPWKKRKYSFRSPKAKGEPLLKKAYGEEGGDDIDYDRRQLSSSDESIGGLNSLDGGSAQRSSVSDFGNDCFAVGSWELKEVTSRDRHMKLTAQIFFASIDQRSKQAAGESACTALVAVIIDWFQSNSEMMPIKSQFDNLIREGSLVWRNLCEDRLYREQFPDKHFDLETILQAKIRPLSVSPQKSFVGFFHPEGCKDDSRFEFLNGATNFDEIWDEICQCGEDCLYIVSWNDHFFVLKVEQDAYYIIDSLGERLYEGCTQAYILKFDENTVIHRNPADKEKRKDKVSSGEDEGQWSDLVCRGKECCKEYIKSFLAAIPIRELQADIAKGLVLSTPIHHCLQIEFHYTESTKEIADFAAFSPPPFWPSPLTRGSLTSAIL